MNKKPYWITQNLQSIPTSLESDHFLFYTYDQVENGKSPLGNLGRDIIYGFIIQKMSPFKEVWIFPKDTLDSKISHRVADIFSLAMRIKCDLALSKPGEIFYNKKNLPVEPQPPNLLSFENICFSSKLETKEAEKSFIMAKILSSHCSYNKYFFQFNYLKELRCTDPYLGYLGLWSFIEIEWADDNKKANIKNSLKKLLIAWANGDRELKKDFTIRLDRISKKVGENFNEYSIRNLLAHGKYHIARSNWKTEDVKEFHYIHNELFKIMFSVLEERIINA